MISEAVLVKPLLASTASGVMLATVIVFKTPSASATTILSVSASPATVLISRTRTLPEPMSKRSVGLAAASVPAIPIPVFPFFSTVTAFLRSANKDALPSCNKGSLSSQLLFLIGIVMALLLPITVSPKEEAMVDIPNAVEKVPPAKASLPIANEPDNIVLESEPIVTLCAPKASLLTPTANELCPDTVLLNPTARFVLPTELKSPTASEL